MQQMIHASIDEVIDTLCDCEIYDEIISSDLKNEVHSLRRRLSRYDSNDREQLLSRDGSREHRDPCPAP